MSDLKIVDLYENSNDKKNEKFIEKTESTMHVQTNFQDNIRDLEWIEKIAQTLPYIDNIFRNPNRFIENDEEIVKIELSKKITVDSIKHLSKHTNFIQDVDKDTGDVIPGKILNVFKEETYETYENKFIYTLMENIRFFISQRKEKILENLDAKNINNKKIEYKANTKLNNEKISMSVNLDSISESGKADNKDLEQAMEKIEGLEKKIMDVTNSEVYKMLDRIKFELVKDPIKKTNVILKNVNFQYAVRLWDYLKDNMEDKTKLVKDSKDYMDDGNLKELIDETFLLDYLAISTLDNNEENNNNENRKKINDNIVTLLLNKMIDIDDTLTEQDIKDMVGQKYAVVKVRNQATIQEVQKIFKNKIDEYLNKIN